MLQRKHKITKPNTYSINSQKYCDFANILRLYFVAFQQEHKHTMNNFALYYSYIVCHSHYNRIESLISSAPLHSMLIKCSDSCNYMLSKQIFIISFILNFLFNFFFFSKTLDQQNDLFALIKKKCNLYEIILLFE